MPDWSYQTILAPTFRAWPEPLRPALHSALDRFGRSPLAGPLVSFLGHMAPDAGQQARVWNAVLPSRVGIGLDLPGDGDLLALVSRFGVGFVEVGPVVGLRAGGTAHDGRRLTAADDLVTRLARKRSHSAPVAVRLSPRMGHSARQAGDDLAAALVALAPSCAFFTLDLPPPAAPGWDAKSRRECLARLAGLARQAGKPLLVVTSGHVETETARDAGAAGLWLTAPSSLASGLAEARRQWPDAVLAAASGVVEPGDAVAALDQGADLVAVDRGLLRSGPGLPKRIHEALRHRRQPKPSRLGLHSLREPWTGMAAMAMVLMVAAFAAWFLGSTRVLLDYDERFLGADRDALDALNPRLLDFLAHDRISFAATTLSLSFLWLQVASHAYARREHWARRLLVASGVAGFASYFLFLGFGYFDPLHLVVWVAALAGFLWGVRRVPPAPPWVRVPDLRNDAAWRRSQWGQLLLVGLGVGLTVAGLAVCVVAVSSVFVSTDLGFLDTSGEELDAANDRLLSLVAHDRAGFGGALVANGVAVLLLSLWGIRRGASWVWWTYVVSGLAGFAGVLWIHARIGYLHPLHMAPAYLAMAVFAAGAALCRRFLLDCGDRPAS